MPILLLKNLLLNKYSAMAGIFILVLLYILSLRSSLDSANRTIDAMNDLARMRAERLSVLSEEAKKENTKIIYRVRKVSENASKNTSPIDDSLLSVLNQLREMDEERRTK